LRASDEVLKDAVIDHAEFDVEGHELKISIGLQQTPREEGAAVLVRSLVEQPLLEARSFLEQFGFSHLADSGLDGPQDLNERPNVIPGFPNYLCGGNLS
jgi:hypothetical protein